MISFFTQLGATQKESRIYLELLKLGAQPVSVLARHLNIPRTSTYVVIDRLKKLNLIEEFNHHGTKFVKAISPQSLKDLLSSKEKRLQQSLTDLETQLPELTSLESKLSITPTIKFYEGKRAVMNMYEEVFREKQIHAFFNPRTVGKIMPEYILQIGKHIQNKKGKAFELITACPEAKKYQQQVQSKNHHIKILSPSVTFEADIIIGKEKIYMISYGEDKICGTVIHNQSLANAQRAMFEQLWSRIK